MILVDTGTAKLFGDQLGFLLQNLKAAGHTPGHTTYMFSSEEQRLLVWGDIVHNAAVQFPHPEVAIEYDWNKQGAIATRRTFLSLAASGQLLVAGAHLPFPGLGRIAVDGSRDYRWVPLEYGPVRRLERLRP